MQTLFGDSPAPGSPFSYLSTQELLAAGMTRRHIARSVSDGRLLRVRKGRFVSTDTQPEMVRAARLGGRVDCTSLLRISGIFVLDRDAGLHIQVSVGASRLPKRPPDIVCHWRHSPVAASALCTDLVEALAQACRCQDPRAAIATLESAWHLGRIGEAGLAEVFARLPLRYRSLRPLLDPRSESGPETLMRLILRAVGCTFEVQAKIPRVGRVDFLVDGWLIIECDSEAYHSGWDAHKRDRRRDLAAAELGYTTIRPIAEDIMYHRDQIFTSVKSILARRVVSPAVRNSSSPPHRGRDRTS